MQCSTRNDAGEPPESSDRLGRDIMRTEKISSKVGYLLARRCARGAQGQAMVELALTLPMLFLILFGVVDLGRWSMAYVAIANASREAARYGMTNSTNPTGIATAAENEA